MKLTIKERLLLEAVRDSEYQDGGDPVGHDIWLDYVVDTKSRGGVLTQLVRKGYVRIEIVPKRDSANREAGISDSTIAMTQAGFDALQQDTCDVINEFGDGQHPVADKESLPYFVPEYVKECLRRAERRHV